MSMYYCFDCDTGRLIDDDYHPCTEHPEKHGEIICPDCAAKWEEKAERMEEEINGEDYIPPRPVATVRPLQQPQNWETNLPDGMTARLVFPAKGDTQTFAGMRNGIWHVWTRYGDDIGRVHQCNDQDAAIEAFDANSDVLKIKMGME